MPSCCQVPLLDIRMNPSSALTADGFPAEDNEMVAAARTVLSYPGHRVSCSGQVALGSSPY